jgi:hypothetical protein
MAGVFGDQTELRYLGEVSIKGKEGEDLCLLYKMTVTSFFFPIFLSKDGYVLGIIERRDQGKLWWSRTKFYPLTDDDIAKWQASGHLPKPLPGYTVMLGDTWYVWLGRFLMVLAAIGGYLTFLKK